MPMIGRTPAFLASRANSRTPKRLPWSVMAIEDCPSSAARAEHLVEALGAVQQRVRRVIVEVRETRRPVGHRPPYSHSIVPGGLLVTS